MRFITWPRNRSRCRSQTRFPTELGPSRPRDRKLMRTAGGALGNQRCRPCRPTILGGVNRIRVAFALSLLLLGACSKERPVQPQAPAVADDATPVDGGTVI